MQPLIISDNNLLFKLIELCLKNKINKNESEKEIKIIKLIYYARNV